MCKINSNQIAADGKAIGIAIEAIANAVRATNPALADKLTAAANVLVTATANWKTGDPVDDINTAAAAIEAILQAIPLTAPYAAFVGIAVAALDVLLANLGTQKAQTGKFMADARMVGNHIDTLPENQWRGTATISHSGDLRKGFEDSWNKAVDEYTGPEVFSKITV